MCLRDGPRSCLELLRVCGRAGGRLRHTVSGSYQPSPLRSPVAANGRHAFSGGFSLLHPSDASIDLICDSFRLNGTSCCAKNIDACTKLFACITR